MDGVSSALVSMTLKMCDSHNDVKSLKETIEIMNDNLLQIKAKLDQQGTFNRSMSDVTLALQTQINQILGKMKEEKENKERKIEEGQGRYQLVLNSAIPIMTITELRTKHLLSPPIMKKQVPPSMATGSPFGQKQKPFTGFAFRSNTCPPKIDIYIKRNNWVMKVDEVDVLKVVDYLEL